MTGEAPDTDKLMAELYSAIRSAADNALREELPGHTLTPTALAHEAYVRLAATSKSSWRDQAHFAAAASVAIRRVLIDHARTRSRLKRGGGKAALSLLESATEASAANAPEDMLALAELLDQLRGAYPRAAQIIDLRFFAGLTNAQAAAVLGVSERTAASNWAFAKAWLQRQATGNGPAEDVLE